MADLVHHPTGGYAYIPALKFASAGVIAAPGMTIARAVFADPPPLDRGFELFEAHVSEVGRPLDAVCGFELRMPSLLPWPDFEVFNAGFVDRLGGLGLVRDGAPTTTRTNVAPAVPVSHDAMYAFSYTVPTTGDPSRAFIVSGTPEMVLPGPYPDSVLRLGETDAEALAAKTAAVIGAVQGVVSDLGAAWTPASMVRLYARHDVAALTSRLLAVAGLAPYHGIVWYEADPPVPDLELEIDLRHHGIELVLPGA